MAGKWYQHALTHAHFFLPSSFLVATLQERNAIATICLRKRAIPARAPPRIIVFTGPGAVGRSKLMRRLVDEYADKFGLPVSTTSRRPREHEVCSHTCACAYVSTRCVYTSAYVSTVELEDALNNVVLQEMSLIRSHVFHL